MNKEVGAIRLAKEAFFWPTFIFKSGLLPIYIVGFVFLEYFSGFFQESFTDLWPNKVGFCPLLKTKVGAKKPSDTNGLRVKSPLSHLFLLLNAIEIINKYIINGQKKWASGPKGFLCAKITKYIMEKTILKKEEFSNDNLM